MDVLQQKKCPCCGGSINFDTASQKLKCPYCDTEFDIEAMKQEEAETATAAPDTIVWESENQQWSQEEKDGIFVYSCHSCGGEIIAEDTTGATKCPYCDSPVVVKGQFEGDLRPDLLIPFQFDKKAAKEALKKHIASKKFVPSVFKDENHLDEIQGVYIPHWLFSGHASANADFKTTKTRMWSDSKFNYTETSHFAVHRSGTLAFADIPVDGSQKTDDALMESIEPFDVSKSVQFRTDYLSGFLAERYDVSSEQSCERANERVKQSITDALSRTVVGYDSVVPTATNMHIADGSCRYALYPVWILNTSWNGQKYTFAMNGQTGKFVGDLPVDKKAVWKRIGILTPILGAVAYAAMWLWQFL